MKKKWPLSWETPLLTRSTDDSVPLKQGVFSLVFSFIDMISSIE